LTCQSSRFIDNSTNNFTLTVVGTPSVQRFNPFGTPTQYSTTTIGGSGYFSGNVPPYNYLSTTGTVGIANNAFTICCWFYPLTSSVTGLFDSGPNQPDVFRNFPANYIEYQAGGTKVLITGAYQVNAWNWMCITKSGTSFTVYINGVSAGSGTCATTMVESTFTVGAINNGGDGNYNGYISDFKVLNTSTVVAVPTTPITNASGKTYLLKFQNAGIFDNAMINDLQTVGDAQISTSVYKYGTGSMKFDGTGDYLIGEPNLTGVFGTGNFTIEAWVYTTASSGTQCVFDTRFTDASTAGCFFGLYSSNAVLFYTSATVLTGGTVTANTWNHIAAVRSGTTVTVYLNGTSVASGTRSNNFTQNNVLIGASFGVTSSTPNNFFGYIDDLRVTKGYARYTANFTPPTAAFPNTGPA
jgi:hypothetical protein